MKRELLLVMLAVLLFSLSSNAALAEDNKLELGDSYYTGDSFEFKGDVYLVNINSYDQVILNYGSKFLVIKNSSCTRKDVYYEFCVAGIKYDTDKREKQADINVYSYEQDVKITRSANVQLVNIGEEINMTVTLTNEGYSTADNITYTDIFPQEFNITIPTRYKPVISVNKSIKYSGDEESPMKTVVWKGDLEKGESVTFMYQLIPLKPVFQRFTANVHYKQGNEYVDEKSEEVELRAKSFVEIYANIVDEDFQPSPGSVIVTEWESKAPIYSGEDMLLVVNLENNYKENESANITELRFLLPEGAEYYGYGYIKVYENASMANDSYLAGNVPVTKVNDRLFTWKGELQKEGKTFVLKLKAAKKGDYAVRVAADIKKWGYPDIYDYSAIKEFTVERNDIIIESNFKEGDKFNSGQTAYFTLYLVNPNTFVNLTEVNVSIDAPWLDKKSFYTKKINSFNYSDIFSGEVIMPSVDYGKSVKFNVNVSYKTQFGEVLNETFERTVRVDPIIGMDITHEVGGKILLNSNSDEIESKETEVILKIKNKLQKDIEGVFVQESLDKRLNQGGGMSNKIILLKKDEAVDVYKYTITPPSSYRWQNFTLRTYISYKFENKTYNGSVEVLLKVKPKKMDIDINKDVLEEKVVNGQIVHVGYNILNKEKEPIKNIVLHFPPQYETDIVGQREYHINELLPGESVIVNEETVRLKKNGSIVLAKTNVTFEDSSGNLMYDASEVTNLDVIDGIIEEPAIFINKSAPSDVVAGEPFTVSIKATNEGKRSAFVTITDEGLNSSFDLAPGKEKIIYHNATVSETGLQQIPKAYASYKYKELGYYTASNAIEVYSNKKVEPRPAYVPEVKEEVKQTEQKTTFNIKYLYLILFIILICVIIMMIIKRQPKKGGFDFEE